VDPTQPEYTRIPPFPIPRAWAKTIQPYEKPESEPPVGSRYIEEDILKMDLLSVCGQQFVAILMDPPWQLPPPEPSCPAKISPAQFLKLKICEKLIPMGFIFIWLEKEIIPEAVEVMRRWGFVYVENFVWIKKHVNNRIVTTDSRFFRRSKTSLLIFRRHANNTDENSLELRHQRNPDVDFDYAHFRSLHPNFGEIEDKPQFVYDIIETLLPTARYNTETGRGRLLELWAKEGTRRTGWTTVVQKQS